MQQNTKTQLPISKAPGKVLIAGGYGVLQQGNFGLSLALENYFYCICQKYDKENLNSVVHISSPQIKQSWTYQYNQADCSVHQTTNKANAFVQSALTYTFKYFKPQKIGSISLLILFSKDFISDNAPKQNIQNQIFLNYCEGYTKTGLGSSACVTVSIIKTLCQLYKQKDNLHLINCLSQIANLSAQNKIGSNFDISTAVFGTQLYKNVLPRLAYQCSKNLNFQSVLDLDEGIKPIITDKKYSYIVDLKQGANTRKMVSSFLKNLRSKSQQIQRNFFQTSKTITLDLFECFEKNAQIEKFKQINNKHRKLQQQYSKITQTPVEPQQLTALIDQIAADANVYYVICPGSGGFDALFILTRLEYQQKLQQIINKRGEVRQIYIKWDQNLTVTQTQICNIQKYISENIY